MSRAAISTHFFSEVDHSMKLALLNTVKGLAAVAALSMLLIPTVSAHSAVSQDKLDFTLHNDTGQEITHVYISETGNTNWEEDILGQDTLATGDDVEITFAGQKANIWDMKVTFADGKSVVWSKINLSTLTDINISFKAGKPWATSKNGTN
jgi:hypothetical protein